MLPFGRNLLLEIHRVVPEPRDLDHLATHAVQKQVRRVPARAADVHQPRFRMNLRAELPNVWVLGEVTQRQANQLAVLPRLRGAVLVPRLPDRLPYLLAYFRQKIAACSASPTISGRARGRSRP
jgi:hypothetical protein